MVMFSVLGSLAAVTMSAPRVYYAMAKDNLFFKQVASLNSKFVPAVALVLQGVWAAFLTLPRTVVSDPKTGKITHGNVYTQLLEYIVSADLIFYILLVGAAIVLRKKAAEMQRPYKATGYPLTAVVYIAIASLLILDLVYLAPKTAGIGFLLVFTGIPVYFIWAGQSASVEAVVKR